MKNPNIEAERARKGLTKKELAEQMGISTKTYYNWINGDVDIPSSKLYEMAAYFGVSMEYLLGVNMCDDKRKVRKNESQKNF